MTKLSIAALTVAVTMTSCSAAYAQSSCGNFEEVDLYLGQQYGEQLNHTFANSVTDTDFVVYSNPETGTWSILEIIGDTACMRAAGIGFVIEPEGEDA